ncbi:OmpA/MotB domain protein [Candidatus Methylobacter favarea]|uniref:OmpA/MotB domain protein n=1 Tax=Candidatus Methylobacter favarea TaxID=2707345 RepID=A0A8S0Y8Q5_9GAMM|nr:OmpA family protein [Candidatus Methylobacter favarea]CAA9889070.1 OmpA/MotB domain protein [Candidatus Methylobacter favarea]
MKNKKLMNKVLLIAGLTAMYGMLSGCATPPNAALDEARSDIANLRSDSVVASKAPVALYDAEKALKQAENTWSDTEDEEEVSHLSYLAKRKAEIAKYTAERNMAEEQLTALKEDRDKMMLQSKTEKVRSLEEELMKMKEFDPRKTNRGLVLTLGDVLFATGKAELNSGSQNNLYQLTTFLRENPDRNILIEGHTDSVGSEDMNLRLSLRRADSVANFLAANGIERSRIATKGYGEAYPKDSNDTVTGRQYNRRVELIVLDPGKTADDVRR